MKGTDHIKLMPPLDKWADRIKTLEELVGVLAIRLRQIEDHLGIKATVQGKGKF